MEKILLIGLGGIGSMYKKLLISKYKLVTVDSDSNKNPDWIDVTDAIKDKSYDLAIICTPNFVHGYKLEEIVKCCKVVLIEKPGLETLKEWQRIYNIKKNIFLVKNNMFRTHLSDIETEILESSSIKNLRILWNNENRVPNPGSWFTDKSKSWGGVSRDLLPHLLSLLYFIFEETPNPTNLVKEQRLSLESIGSTKYGNVNKDGVYDVDDYCLVSFKLHNIDVAVECNWKSNQNSKIGIELENDMQQKEFYELGLCPNDAYLKMITYFLSKNLDAQTQNKIDTWILKIITK